MGAVAGVVVVLAGGLIEILRDGVDERGGENVLAGDDGADEKGDEEDQEDKIEHCVAPDAAFAKLGLLHRVDWWTNLSAKDVLVVAGEGVRETYLGRSQKSMTE